MKRVISVFFIFLTIGCSDGKKPLLGETDWQRAMNAKFKNATTSPLTNKDRKQFSGLDFFNFDASYVVQARLKRTPDSQFFKMKTNTSDVSEERIYGILTFELNGSSHQLNVYQGKETMETPGYEDHLFLPFLDDTTGDLTYGGGRYLDLKIPEGDVIEIDFNKSYNPYCAYNENFSCPLVPRENYLNTEVEVGMKSYNKLD